MVPPSTSLWCCMLTLLASCCRKVGRHVTNSFEILIRSVCHNIIDPKSEVIYYPLRPWLGKPLHTTPPPIHTLPHHTLSHHTTPPSHTHCPITPPSPSHTHPLPSHHPPITHTLPHHTTPITHTLSHHTHTAPSPPPPPPPHITHTPLHPAYN